MKCGKTNVGFAGYNVRKRTPGERKKFAVCAKKGSKIKLVRFGDPDPRMKIKKSNPARKRSYCARSAGIKGGTWDIFSPNFWSRNEWGC